jgi:acyl-CoA synthetase (NDP forming)
VSRTTVLNKMFNAESIAVIGASNKPCKASYQIIKTMIEENFAGLIYPVNPSEKLVLGLPCYPSLSHVESKVDLLIISVPAESVFEVLKTASDRKEVGGAVILSAGFSETGLTDRIKLEKAISVLAEKTGLGIIGPNCVGLINTENKLCTSFSPGIKLKKGSLGFLSQSGAFGGSFLMLAGDQPEPLGFSKFAHVGNAADISMIDILDYYDQDEKTSTIAMYLEGVVNGKQLLEKAKQITREKPIFSLKVGKTEGGSQATLSHTATLAGSDRIYDAAFKQGGIVRVENIEELLDVSKAASMIAVRRGRRLCILTEAGGPGIIALDELGKRNVMHLASLQNATKAKIAKILPTMATICKPEGYIDMTAAALEYEHAEVLRCILEDEGVDAVILITLPPTFLPPENVASAVMNVVGEYDKPVAVCMMNGEVMKTARRQLELSGIPTFDTPDRAVRALEDLARAAEFLKQNDMKKPFIDTHTLSQEHIEKGEQIGLLLESEAANILEAYNIPYPSNGLARRREDAVCIAQRIGYPVVLKVVSYDIAHKSDIGGVIVGNRDADEVLRSFDKISAAIRRAKPEAIIEGILVCQQAQQGMEAIVGAMDDPTFGTTVMFGLGGIFAEALDDVSFRVAPLERRDAEEMIGEIKGYPLLTGIRGQEAIDQDKLAKLIMNVSRLVMERPEIKQLDLNPIRLYPESLLVLDVRMLCILKAPGNRLSKRRSR